MYKSLQHVVVSRSFVQYACYGEKTALIMLYLANIRTSDEMLLPTLIQVRESRVPLCYDYSMYPLDVLEF